MIFRVFKTLIFWSSLLSFCYAENALKPAVTESIPISKLKNYADYSPEVKKLIHESWVLSTKNLTYQFGSSDPTNKGMDCSGTMYYLLKKSNVSDVPRDSNEMYQWVQQAGHFHHVNHQDFSSPDFSALKPGDLLFWSGTYDHKTNSISHVMLYLGKTKENKPIMFGSSDGRSYEGKKMWGVSVFDFQLPYGKSTAKFEGYSCIPTLTCMKDQTE